MQTKKEEWIESTLNVSANVQRIAISEGLKKRLHAIPYEIQINAYTIPLKSVWLAAASIALLITVNVLSIRHSKKEQVSSTMYTTYFSYLDEL